jgi:hypothetical protein
MIATMVLPKNASAVIIDKMSVQKNMLLLLPEYTDEGLGALNDASVCLAV